MDCDFCNYEDFKNQILYESEHFYVIYPRSPVFEYHFMFVVKEHRPEFVALTDDESVDLKKSIKYVKNSFSKSKDLRGYNLFSNNGDESVGQSIAHYHCHMFARFADEKRSPYEIMSNEDLQEKVSTEAWKKRRSTLRKTLN